jgi:hypothetical protein
MNGGKDVKFGHDKRIVSIVPNDEVNLYNIANGEILTDEFGTPLISEVDTFYIPDASKKRATSVTFSNKNTPYHRTEYTDVGIATALYGDFDIYVSTGVAQTTGSTVGFGTTVALESGGYVTLNEYPYLEVRTVSDQGVEKNRIYFDDSVGVSSIFGVSPGDQVYGANIVPGTTASKVNYNSRICLSNDTTNVGVITQSVEIDRGEFLPNKSNVVWKIAEQFKESSEVSTTLLGVTRAETQLSLFSNVSSYGIDTDEFEFFSYVGGISFGSWESRKNAVYGNRYTVRESEETQESGIRIASFPTPYSFPFGPKFEKLGYYNADLFNRYLLFIQLGNDLYNYYNVGSGSGYPEDWKSKFLSPGVAYVESGDVVYAAGITDSFAQIDVWTDTWRDIKDALLRDPITGDLFDFSRIGEVLATSDYDSTTTRPGYSETAQRYGQLQSRRVFRYQPGRISGFTFGLRSSIEPNNGIILEWGISNATDEYMFRVEAGQFYIVRRSTVPLEKSALERSGLTLFDQVKKGIDNPYSDGTEYWTIEIPRDKFNGDGLNSNGPSGYLLQPDNVTMYKIEFGWYGAIGARFYAYIPVGAGEARWVVMHTLVIENSLGQPCLQDSYFRFKYAVNIANTGDVRTPQFLYKYGTSYYIDGGDEGTTQSYSVSSKQRIINTAQYKSLIGVSPKDFIYNSLGVPIQNRKLILPTQLNITTDSLTEVKIARCAACPGFGHAYTPGVASTTFGKSIEVEFLSTNTITTTDPELYYFTPDDIGSKIIAPSIYNAYISSVQDQIGEDEKYETAIIKGYNATSNPTLVNRNIGGELVFDRVTGITTTIGIGTVYPHPIRLTNYDSIAISNFALTGSKIEINFVNPIQSDSYAHYADFLIGVTDFEPQVQEPDTLEGFDLTGIGLTTKLPNSNILFAEHTHSNASMNENGVETSETYSPTRFRARMEIDDRIRALSSPAGGYCSRLTVEVQDPLPINNVNEFNYLPNSGSTDPDPEGRTWIQVAGAFPNVDYNGGEIVILNNTTGAVTQTGSQYVGVTSSYVGAGGSIFSYIQTSQTLGAVDSNFTILIRPVNVTGTFVNKSKLFAFNPFPLYLVCKLRDNAAINNISITEYIGDLKRTISPKWYAYNATVTNAGGNADVSGASPTNFQEINRLSSALIDTQNDQRLRPYLERDTLYIGANETKTIDLSKIFGSDRTVITPDNNNVEATFFIAKKLDAGSEGTVECSISYKEQ